MTRVLQAMAGARHGGAEIFFTRLALALARAGEEQRIVIRRDAERAATLRAGGVHADELAFGGVFDWTTRRRLKAIVAAWRPQVVLTWMNRATALCPRGEFVHVARLGGYYDLKYYRRCDHLIGNTPDIVAYLVRQGWPAARAHYLPNFVPARAAPPAPRALFDTPSGAPLALALGRLHQNKGFDVLLEALAAAPGVQLWLAGEGPRDADLKDQARRLGIAARVRFLGWRADTAALLAAADMLVCPSRHEPLGNVVIEAWAAGVPVIAAASQGPSALIRDGENGLLVPIDAAKPLATAMNRLAGAADERARLAAAGRRSYEAEFTESAVVARYRAFFRKVAA